MASCSERGEERAAFSGRASGKVAGLGFEYDGRAGVGAEHGVVGASADGPRSGG
jgi:hypothetical protein